MSRDTQLPADTETLLALAAKSMFEAYARDAMGAMVVDRDHRVVWISDGYLRFLPGLGFTEPSQFVGRRVEEVVPNTLMAHVIDTGRPILVDLLTNQAGSFLVSRLPLRDDAGRVIGAVGFVLLDHPETTMQPLIAKFTRLQAELDSAHRRLAEQRRPRHTIASFIGSSPAALEVKRHARRVAMTGSTVLLLGETGTGKELLAHGIHAASPRAARRFVGVNIAAVPETLMEAEFFGVAPGAYTGADRRGREGKFKHADGGTLFLDEIGDMPLALQSKLLRVLQEQEIEPLGANRVERIDVRIVAATSRDLAAMVADGAFRADLYYRLAVLPIRLPPLRERLADLEALVEALSEDIARRSGMPVRSASPDALALLARQSWAGNIRELRNTLEQAALMTDDLVLEASHFDAAVPLAASSSWLPRAPAVSLAGAAVPAGPQPAVANAVGGRASPVSSAASSSRAGSTGPTAESASAASTLPLATSVPSAPLRPLAEQVAEVEHAAIAAALHASGGNRVEAARRLRMSRAALYERLKKWPDLGDR